MIVLGCKSGRVYEDGKARKRAGNKTRASIDHGLEGDAVHEALQKGYVVNIKVTDR